MVLATVHENDFPQFNDTWDGGVEADVEDLDSEDSLAFSVFADDITVSDGIDIDIGPFDLIEEVINSVFGKCMTLSFN